MQWNIQNRRELNIGIPSNMNTSQSNQVEWMKPDKTNATCSMFPDIQLDITKQSTAIKEDNWLERRVHRGGGRGDQETRVNFLEWRVCLLSWLRWQFFWCLHICLNLPNYTLYICEINSMGIKIQQSFFKKYSFWKGLKNQWNGQKFQNFHEISHPDCGWANYDF